MEQVKDIRNKTMGSMDILHMEKLLTRSGGSLYRLVRLAMVRALELADGKPSLITNPMSEKLATVALQEIFQGKVALKKITKVPILKE